MVKLSQKERDILACAELRAEAPIEVLRRETGYRDHTIRYHLKRLEERGVIRAIPLINLHPLGYLIFNIFFSIGAQKKRAKEELLRAFVASPHVVWVGEFGGDFQYGIAICVRKLGEMLELLSALSHRFHDMFFEKSISCQFSTTVFHRKYLSAKKFKVKPLVCRSTTDTIEIDELDQRILSALSSIDHRSHRQLAQKTQIPLSTLELRLKKLRERKIVIGSLYAVDSAKVGVQSYKLLVYARGMDPDLSSAIAAFAEAHPRINYMIECLGSWDIELGVDVEKPEQVMDVVQEIYESFGPSLNSVKVLSKFRDIKFRWYLGVQGPNFETDG